jgi:hypothetical protein
MGATSRVGSKVTGGYACTPILALVSRLDHLDLDRHGHLICGADLVVIAIVSLVFYV